jgi:hypothetical protein
MIKALATFNLAVTVAVTTAAPARPHRTWER